MELLTRINLSSPIFELDCNLTWVNCLPTPAATVIGSQGIILARYGLPNNHTSLISPGKVRCVAVSDSVEKPLIAVLTVEYEIIIYQPSFGGWYKYVEFSESNTKITTITYFKDFLVGGGLDGKLYFYSLSTAKKPHGRGKKSQENNLPYLNLSHTHELQFPSAISLLKSQNDDLLIGSKSGLVFIHDGKSPKDIQLWSEEDDLPSEQGLLYKYSGKNIAVFCKGSHIVIVKGSESKFIASLCQMKVTGIAKIRSMDETKALFIMASLEERLVLCELDLTTLNLTQSEIASEAVKDRSCYKGLASSPYGLLFSFSQAAVFLMDKSTKKPNNLILYSTQSIEAICSWLDEQETDCKACMSEVIEYVCTLKFLLASRSIPPQYQNSKDLTDELRLKSVKSLKVMRHKILLCKDFYANWSELLDQIENLIPRARGKGVPCPICSDRIQPGINKCPKGHTFQRCPKSGDLCDPGMYEVKQCLMCSVQFVKSDSYFICCLCF